ncbi:MAG: TatD family hydrolase [Bryobacteraceae bacterium]
MKLVDSHCHLDDEKFAPDFEQVLQRALDAGVERMMAIGTGDGPPDLEAAVRLADAYPFVYATVGVHPHDAAKAQPESFDRLRALLDHPKVLALGEIGLDYHYDFSPRDVQREVFTRQLELAADARKPVVIHTREAWRDTVDLLERHRSTLAGGIFHCFSGGAEEAAQALDLGFHLSFAGIVTFPKAENVREAASIAPLDRLLVETDAPYLAPAPHRGKRNEPSFAVHTARCLAEIRGVTAEEIAAATTANFERLLGLR